MVRSGASLVTDGVINGSLIATGAEAVQLFGTRINGTTLLSGTTRDVTIAGSTFEGALSLADNTQVSTNERFSRLAGEYGPILVGSTVNGALSREGNSAEVNDFGAPSRINGLQGATAQLYDKRALLTRWRGRPAERRTPPPAIGLTGLICQGRFAPSPEVSRLAR
jgi:hypothetical protein